MGAGARQPRQVIEGWAIPDAEELAARGWLERRTELSGDRSWWWTDTAEAALRPANYSPATKAAATDDCARAAIQRRARQRGGRSMLPYVVITSDDPTATLGEGQKQHFATMLAAANAFAESKGACKQIVYDNEHEVRWLNAPEQRLLHKVCGLLGLEVEDVA